LTEQDKLAAESTRSKSGALGSSRSQPALV
jgi:hypothetical protein